MAQNRTMSTEQIKRGLENIKKAQLQVLKQLRGDSFGEPQLNNSISNIRYNNSSYQYNSTNTYNKGTDENGENVQMNANRANKSHLQVNKYERNYQSSKKYEASLLVNQDKQQRKQSNNSSLRTNYSTQPSLSHQSYQALRKQFTSQRQELNKKLTQITSKLNQLQRQSAVKQKQSTLKAQSRVQQGQLQRQFKQAQLLRQFKRLEQEKKQLEYSYAALKQQNAELKQLNTRLKQQAQQWLRVQKKLRSELQLKSKQKTILQTQIKSLKSQSTKQSRSLNQLQAQIYKYTHTIHQLKQQALKTQQALINSQQTRINIDTVMKQVKSISSTHDFMFNKLKQSTTIDMTIVEKQQTIQNCFTRLLDYFETLSSSGSAGYLSVNGNGNGNEEEGYRNTYINNKRSSVNQSKQLIKRSIISQSRAEEQQELQYFVREIGTTISRKQANQLMNQNQLLKRKLNQLTHQKPNQSIIYKNTHDFNIANTNFHNGNMNFNNGNMNFHNNNNNNKMNYSDGKYEHQSKRLISLQLQEMREQVQRFKRLKVQMKQDQQQLQKQTIKHKLKAKELQSKLQTTQRKLTDTTNIKYNLQKKNQQQSIQIIELNSVIKQLNSKLYTNTQHDSPLTQLRTEFNKLLQTNSLLQRQSQSLKAMNQALQVQIQTLKYEKDQYEANNQQKHQLIQRQIQQRNHLLQDMHKYSQKHKLLQQEIDKLNQNIKLNEQQTLKTKKHYQDLLQQQNHEVITMRKQLQQLYKQSREYHQIRFTLDQLQNQHKQLTRKNLKIGQTLTHLWSVKEAEYHNINQLLGLLKNTNEPFDAQNSAHF